MKKKGVKLGIIGVVVAVVLILGVFIGKQLFPTVNAVVEITNAMKPFLEAENQSMNLTIGASEGEEVLWLEAKLYAVKEADVNYMALEQEEAIFYVVDNMLLLENGKAFLLTEDKNKNQEQENSEASTSFLSFLPLLATAYEEFEIVRTQKDNIVQYQIEVTGEQVQKLLEAAMASNVDMVQAIDCLQVTLTTVDGTLSKLQMDGKTSVGDSQVSIAMLASDFTLLEAGEYQIPQLIQDSAKEAKKEELFCLTEDLYRLVKALEPLKDTKSLQGSVTLTANCGMLKVNTTMDMKELQSMTTSGGNSTNQEDIEIQNPEEIQALPELIGMMFMEGELSCTEKNGAYEYALVLDEEAMSQLASTIMPEMLNYAVDYSKGSVSIVVKDNMIRTMTVEITGSMNALITKVPVSVGVEFLFEYDSL